MIGEWHSFVDCQYNRMEYGITCVDFPLNAIKMPVMYAPQERRISTAAGYTRI